MPNPNKLVSMSAAEINHLYDIETRFLTLCNLYKRKHGIELIVPNDMRPAFKIWRTVMVRMENRNKRGPDRRCSKNEAKAIDDVMKWIYKTACEVRGVEPELPV